MGYGAKLTADQLLQLPTQKDLQNKITKFVGVMMQTFTQAYGAVKYKGPNSFVNMVTTQLQKVPAVAREQAAQAMLTYAQELIAKGQLPKSALGKTLDAIKQILGPGFSSWMKQHGGDTDVQLAQSFKLTTAQASLKAALEKIKADFGYSMTDIKNAPKDLPTAYAQIWTQLEKDSKSKWPGVAQPAKDAMTQLRADANKIMGEMGKDFDTNLGKIETSFKTKPKEGAIKAAQAFADFASGVGAAMDSGVISTSQGGELIRQAMNKAIGAFGGKPIGTVAVIQSSLAAAAKGLAGKIVSFGAAGGALMQIGRPGDKGHDNIPLNVGGIPVLVGSGEQVAVLNASQQQYLNQRLAPEGGLPGFFQRVNKPHYMSSGGIVPRHAAAGSLVTASDFTAYPTASGRNHIPGFAELSHNYGAGVRRRLFRARASADGDHGFRQLRRAHHQHPQDRRGRRRTPAAASDAARD